MVTLPDIQQKVRLGYQRFHTCHLNDTDATHSLTRNVHAPNKFFEERNKNSK